MQGPINRPKDGIAALCELDFTRPDTPVRFEKGEPYCYIFPVSCGALEGLESNLKCSQPTRGSSASTCVDGDPRASTST